MVIWSLTPDQSLTSHFGHSWVLQFSLILGRVKRQASSGTRCLTPLLSSAQTTILVRVPPPQTVLQGLHSSAIHLEKIRENFGFHNRSIIKTNCLLWWTRMCVTLNYCGFWPWRSIAKRFLDFDVSESISTRWHGHFVT